ncbi:hypothetical protein RT717_14050 [Imperialibacter roseus]|uniref:Transposase n=1 Tax=Imperialibacter roseus TaxID=1324217 RepID=A0ABZ0IGS0_9BACT|nr:hypothetical protein [Imperialibacter roseus]WOK04198.1 hypothetical protein RT717_14050 [Imperialibacter roseus]
MEGKFKVGEMVAERIRPTQKLVVKRQAYNVYYCKMTEDLSRKELVFHERELQAYEGLASKLPVMTVSSKAVEEDMK